MHVAEARQNGNPVLDRLRLILFIQNVGVHQNIYSYSLHKKKNQKKKKLSCTSISQLGTVDAEIKVQSVENIRA